jgi:hypothetical protein
MSPFILTGAGGGNINQTLPECSTTVPLLVAIFGTVFFYDINFESKQISYSCMYFVNIRFLQ